MSTNEAPVIEKLLVEENGKLRNAPQTKPPIWFSKRFVATVVIFLCTIAESLLRNNINIAIIEMTSNKELKIGNVNVTQQAEFHWDPTIMGLVISIYSYGGLFAFLGGFVVHKLGGSYSSAIALIVGGITTVLHPVCLRWHFYAFLACRFVTGLFGIIFLVSTAEIFSQWIPKSERSTLISFAMNGINVGLAISYPLGGFIGFKWGWPMVFYVTGILSVISALICLYFVKNRPSQDKGISDHELQYILKGTDMNMSKKRKPPYKSILTSAPVWCQFIGNFVFNWIILTVLGACFPQYIKDITNKNTEEIGYITCIPNGIRIFAYPICGMIMDYWKNHSQRSVTWIHKSITTIALISAAILFIAVTFISDFVVCVALFVIIQVLFTSNLLILKIDSVAIAPSSSSFISGCISLFMSLASIVSRTVTGFMITNQTIDEWNNVFMLSAAITVFSAVSFLLFGSSEVQPWSLPPNARAPSHSSNKK